VASLVDASSAVMNGTVNPNGHTTTWYFEYGTSTSYGARTENHNVGNGTVAVSVADTARKLNAATTYHFRLVAFSSRGTTRGADATFKTLGPPTARTGPVTQISTSSATVSGRVNTFGLAGTYWIEYGHTASYGLRTNPANLTPTSSDVGVSVGLSGVEPGRRYHFRVVVSTTGGTTASNDSSFGTAALPRSPSGRIVHCTITGTTGPDTLRGTPGPDVICGLGGADLIFGLGGNDVIYAGPGNDIVIAGAGNDVVYGGPGDDRIEGGRGRDRQRGQIELIASENFTWPAVLEAVGSVPTNKYAEGYPGKRYYGGCEIVDEIEQLAIDRAKALFGAEHANVQPHAGAQANMAVYLAAFQPGDTVLSLRLDHGGHLTHGLKVNFSGRLYTIVHYGVSRETSLVDYDEVLELAR